MKRAIFISTFFIAVFLFFGLKIMQGEKDVLNFNSKIQNSKLTAAPNYGQIELYFVPNKGQVNEKALFYAKTSRYTLWITKEGLVFDSVREFKDKAEEKFPKHQSQSTRFERDVSRLMFLNANKNPEVVPVDRAECRVSYFKGKDPSKWRANIQTSKAVLYKEI